MTTGTEAAKVRALAAITSLRALTLTISVLLVGGAPTVFADERLEMFDVYAIDGAFVNPGRTSTLYRIDPESGRVRETVGDTGLRLSAIAYWPPTASLLAATSLNDPMLPGHLVELDAATAEFQDLGAFVAAATNQGTVGPSEVMDLAPLDRFEAGYSLAVLRKIHPDDTGIGRQLFVSSSSGFDLPSTNLEILNPGALTPGIFSEGVFGMGSASWMDENYIDVVTAGCWANLVLSTIRPVLDWAGDPLPPSPGTDLPDPTCVVAMFETGTNSWLAVQTDRALSAPRRLTAITLNNNQATLEDVGALPDHTVGISLGPASIKAVPALSRLGLLVLLISFVLVVVLRTRAGAWGVCYSPTLESCGGTSGAKSKES